MKLGSRYRRLARWLRQDRAQRNWSANFLWPRREMWAMLDRERMRTMRNGGVFSLLTFSDLDEQPTALIHALQQRLRITDVAGYLRRGQIGVFLPDTPQHGARQVAREVLALLPPDHPTLRCQIFVYPEPRQFDNHDHNGHSHEHEQAGGGMHLLTSLAGRNGHELGGLVEPHFEPRPLSVLFVQPLPLWKRALDVACAGTGLVLLAPVLLSVAAAVKCTSPGPVLFAQRRAGLGGKPFTLWKFRTMVPDAEARRAELMHLNEQDGPAFKIKVDPRVTSIGRLLRSTSLDELPQLWNVLRGEMSLVGPRPLPVGEAAGCAHWQQRRVEVTPGLTCIWQVHGRSSVQFDDWMRMDLQYARRRSLWRDLTLLLQTIPAVLSRRGAS